ncbi:hypothetical protein QS257_06645 [Terrilactibacillus sp. S3-3]|nr:hypothetical protein QS257_06645 [Terrilactibacillus sp. S3-3]
MVPFDNQEVENEEEEEEKENYTFDIDRMMNEGLAGGVVSEVYDAPSIDEARPLEKEEKPRHC